jgi:hypothetical protein
MPREISNTDDIIDSRDVIARIEELEESISNSGDCYHCGKLVTRTDEGEPWLNDAGSAVCPAFEKESPHQDIGPEDEAEAAELRALKALATEAEGYAADWHHGETLIRDSYFEEYARDLAEDIHGREALSGAWPFGCIDWQEAAEQLQQDYTSVDFGGVTFWIR